MKRSFNLLPILSIISLQLWAAEPAAPESAAAAAAPARFESKISAEHHDYSRILAKLKEIAEEPEFRIDQKEWAHVPPDQLRKKTNCAHTAQRLIQKITQTDIYYDHYIFHFEYGLDLHLGSNEFQGTMEEFLSKSKISRDLFDDSTKKEYQLFYILKYVPIPGKYHVFLVLKIDNPPKSSCYILLQTWHKICTLQESIIGTIHPSPLTQDLVPEEDYAIHKSKQSRFNPTTNRLKAADIKNFMYELFAMDELRMPATPPLYYIKKFDLPNSLPFMAHALFTPSPSIPEENASASPSPVPAKKV